MSLLAPTVQAFFTERLMSQRNASPRTIASYRGSGSIGAITNAYEPA